MSKYIVYQPQDDQSPKSIHTVFGLGDSEESAWDDAAEWCDHTDGLLCEECSDSLAVAIAAGKTQPPATWSQTDRMFVGPDLHAEHLAEAMADQEEDARLEEAQ